MLAALCVVLCGCGDEKNGPGTADTSDEYRLSGTLLDAETGEAVPRAGIYVHVFCDEVNLQKTVNPDETKSDFEVLVPKPKVRLRVYDGSHVYALYERTMTLASKTERVEVRLEPTNYIKLRGRVLDGSTGKPIPPPDPATAREIETLKNKIDSNQRDLAQERERSHKLQRKLACTEALLNQYGQCTERYDTASQAYWNCVEEAVAGRQRCQIE